MSKINVLKKSGRDKENKTNFINKNDIYDINNLELNFLLISTLEHESRGVIK